jgi:cytochrome c553
MSKTSSLLKSLLALAVSLGATVAFSQDVKGDAAAGEKKNAMCIGCHGIAGYQASFPEIYRVPKISGQSEKFIVSSLKAYKSGERKHPTMRAISESLSDQDMADLAAFYAQHGSQSKVAAEPSRQPSAEVAALLEKGACATCHGKNFSTPIDPSYPKLGGQHADYLFVALKSYANNTNASWGRGNGIMQGVLKNPDGSAKFSNAELKAIAKYLSSLEGETKTVAQSKFR